MPRFCEAVGAGVEERVLTGSSITEPVVVRVLSVDMAGEKILEGEKVVVEAASVVESTSEDGE